MESIERREFGFDHTGEGPSDRKNAFSDVRDLEDYIRATAPYAAYSSVAFTGIHRKWKAGSALNSSLT